MLGKLLKHEWRAVWKVPTLLIGIVMITAVAAGLTFALPIWDSEWIGLPISGILLILLFYFALIAVGAGIMIYFAVRYYKNMFTDEGYLTHTLPVTARQLLLSKVINMSIWNLIGGIAMIAGIVVFLGTAVLSLSLKEGSLAADLLEVAEMLKHLWKEPFFQGFSSFAASGICMVVVSSVNGSLMIIGAITLGQMVRKHRVLGSVGAYFAINTVVSSISMALLIPMMVRMTTDEVFLKQIETAPFSFYTTTYTIMTVVMLVAAVGLYFFSEYLLRRKLELE